MVYAGTKLEVLDQNREELVLELYLIGLLQMLQHVENAIFNTENLYLCLEDRLNNVEA